MTDWVCERRVNMAKTHVYVNFEGETMQEVVSKMAEFLQSVGFFRPEEKKEPEKVEKK
jgi:hypothetical protein